MQKILVFLLFFTAAFGSPQLELGYEALEKGCIEEAMLHTERGLKESPENPKLLLLYAKVLDKRGNPQGALRELKKAIQLDPNDQELYFERDRIFQKLGLAK